MRIGLNHWNRYGLWYAIGVFAATRGLIWLVACTAPQDRSRPTAPDWWSPIPTMRWDAGHYLAILEHGYPLEDGGLPTPPHSDTVAFFPAFPLIGRALTRWMDGDLALVVLAHASSLLAMVFLYLWARRRYDGRVGFWSVVLLSTYPPAMFFSAGYADALLVLCVAAALWLLDHGRVWAAAAVTGLATATRPTGLCPAAVVTLWAMLEGVWPRWFGAKAEEDTAGAEASDRSGEAGYPTDSRGGFGSRRREWGRRLLRTGGVGLLCLTGFIAFQLHLWHHYGRPDAFVAVQQTWKVRSELPQPVLWLVTLKPLVHPAMRPIKYAIRGVFHTIVRNEDAAADQFKRLLDPMGWNAFFNLVMVVLGVIGLLRPGRVPRIVFLLPILVFLEAYLPDPYRGSRMVGIARYQLIALPAFLLAAAWLAGPRHTILRYSLCAVMLTLQCVYARLFADWWVAG